jgi:tetratricopeptide (TPR) repeat protein
MLETIREFAHEELSAKGEVEAMRVRHGGYFLSRAIESEPRLTGPDQAVWLDYWDREQDNLRAALRWAIDAGRTDLAQEAAGAIWRFWQQRGHLAEGRQWIDAVLAMAGPLTAARAKALTGGGGIAWWQIDHPAAQAFYTEALTIERELGDPARLAEALYNHAFALGAAGDIEQATRNLEESLALFRASGNEHGIARALVMMVIRDSQVGDWDSAVAKLQESVGIWRRFGDRLQLAFDLIWLAFAYGRAQRWDDARSAALESLDLFRASGNPTGIALAFRDLAFISNWQGRPVDALRLAAASESIRVQIGGGPPQGFGGMLQGDPAGEAREQLSEADAQRSWDEGFRMDVDEAVALARGGGGEKL